MAYYYYTRAITTYCNYRWIPLSGFQRQHPGSMCGPDGGLHAQDHIFECRCLITLHVPKIKLLNSSAAILCMRRHCLSKYLCFHTVPNDYFLPGPGFKIPVGSNVLLAFKRIAAQMPHMVNKPTSVLTARLMILRPPRRSWNFTIGRKIPRGSMVPSQYPQHFVDLPQSVQPIETSVLETLHRQLHLSLPHYCCHCGQNPPQDKPNSRVQ
jgi:hypothetical protein